MAQSYLQFPSGVNCLCDINGQNHYPNANGLLAVSALPQGTDISGLLRLGYTLVFQ